jgi:integrase
VSPFVTFLGPARAAGRPARFRPGIFARENPKIQTEQYVRAAKQYSVKNMGDKGLKSLPTKQNKQIVPLKKTAKKAGKTCARKPAKRAKQRALKAPTCLTTDETRRLLKVIKSPRDKAIFSILYYCGLRASEPGLLLFSDYQPGSARHLDRIMIRRKKNSLSGETALVPACSEALRGWVRRRGHVEGPLFPSRNRQPISRSRIFALMRQYCAAAGIPLSKAHPHCLKHSCVSHLLGDQRESIIDTQRHVGHASIQSTMRYLHLGSPFDDARI